MPLMIQIMFLLLTRRPEVLILRDRTRPSLVTALMARLTRVPHVVFYDQFPADDPLAYRAGASTVGLWLQRRLGLLSIPSITPIPPESFYTTPHGEEASVPPGRFFVPFVVDATQPRAAESYCPNGVLRILVVGKYRPYKNLDLVSEAVQLLEVEQREMLDITFVGQENTSAERAFRLALKTGLEAVDGLKAFRLLSNVPHDEMQDLYSSADVSILPSSHDLAAIAPLEAMAHGVVPIVTIGNGTTPYVHNATNGFVMDPSQPDTLSSILKKLLVEKEVSASIALTGAKFAHDELSPFRFNESLAKVLAQNNLQSLR